MSQKAHSLQRHLPGLDGLRAIACLMVFAVHFGQITRLQGAFGPFDLADSSRMVIPGWRCSSL